MQCWAFAITCDASEEWLPSRHWLMPLASVVCISPVAHSSPLRPPGLAMTLFPSSPPLVAAGALFPLLSLLHFARPPPPRPASSPRRFIVLVQVLPTRRCWPAPRRASGRHRLHRCISWHTDSRGFGGLLCRRRRRGSSWRAGAWSTHGHAARALRRGGCVCRGRHWRFRWPGHFRLGRRGGLRRLGRLRRGRWQVFSWLGCLRLTRRCHGGLDRRVGHRRLKCYWVVNRTRCRRRWRHGELRQAGRLRRGCQGHLRRRCCR